MVVFLDLKMPKVDGIEVLRTIKNDVNLKPIPVVMLTSSREERDLAQSYALGANAYVVKPVEFHQFITAVKELGVFWGVINEPPPEGSEPRCSERVFCIEERRNPAFISRWTGLLISLHPILNALVILGILALDKIKACLPLPPSLLAEDP